MQDAGNDNNIVGGGSTRDIGNNEEDSDGVVGTVGDNNNAGNDNNIVGGGSTGDIGNNDEDSDGVVQNSNNVPSDSAERCQHEPTDDFDEFKHILFYWKTNNLVDLTAIQPALAKGCRRFVRMSPNVNVFVVDSEAAFNPKDKMIESILDAGRSMRFVKKSWFGEFSKPGVNTPPSLKGFLVARARRKNEFFVVE
eukprot:TRINITY_DN1463_c0_g1_i1.p1 TRINITY_DN1463_c0_g1~~TRINITY_DN1463_c0_g1_i1.p1  ORF type:complete len:195 (-),score=33.70 TRINITY_DN1463_c0_g1_i1:102-686(-)